MLRLLVPILLALMVGFPALAGDFGPVIPKASGKPHPEGNLFMRISHMKLMKHDRDQTMRFGDRDISHSLKACVDCHAVDGEDGEPVSAKSEKHFCRTCHDYVAVKIDCFQCHNSKPDVPRQALLRKNAPDSTKITAYLQESDQ